MAANAKYAYLGEEDPSFRKAYDESGMDENMKELWSQSTDEFKATWRTLPPALLEDSPTDEELDITHRLVKVRDGYEVELRIYCNKGIQPDAPLFLVAHGGGWTVGGHDIEEGINRQVARHTSALVASIDYRMAPEFRYPYAINDCFDILQWSKSSAKTLGIDPERIIVGGGSAGGNIAAVLAQMARDNGITGVIGQVLNIPVTCHPRHFPKDRFEYTSWQQNKNAPIIDEYRMKWLWDQYLPKEESEVYASPLLAKSFTGLPPALFQIAGMDPLRDEGIAYADSLKEAGVPVTVKLYKGMPHGFYFLTNLPEAHDYVTNVVDWINDLLSK